MATTKIVKKNPTAVKIVMLRYYHTICNIVASFFEIVFNCNIFQEIYTDRPIQTDIRRLITKSVVVRTYSV